MVRYPHILAVVRVSSERDADGYVVPTENGVAVLGECRYESQGKGMQIAREDGTQVYYTGVIYAPSLCCCLKEGDIVSVRKPCGEEMVRKPVISISRTQLHARIWV